MDLQLAGKVALITRASRGIGLAAARGFAREGCRLVLAARSARPLDAAADELRANETEVLAVPADVTKPEDVGRVRTGPVRAGVTVDDNMADPARIAEVYLQLHRQHRSTLE